MKFYKPNGYDAAEILPENGGSRPRLPKGGYVCKIMSVEERTSKNGNPFLVFNMDICEGEYMGFWAEDYTQQTGDNRRWHFSHRLMIPTDNAKPYTLHLFKTFNTYLEDSNPNWHFDWAGDEKQYRGKIIGVLVNEKEYRKRNGSIGTTTNIARIVKANTIRSGAYTVPDDERLKKEPTEAYDVPDNVDDDDLPFN